nr:hypothetical protein [Oscillospiraceae bacterium]
AAAAGPVPRLLPPSFERLRGEPPRCAFRGRSFVFETDGTLPERPWQQLLTNGRLGCLVTGSGCAFLWLDNARELPLTPPPRLPEEAGAETLCALVGERSLSLFAANDGIPCRVRYAPGLAEWEKTLGGRRVKTTVFVSRDPAARITLVEGAEGLRLRWTLRPSLSADDPEALRCRTDDGLFCAENPACVRPELRFWAGSSRPAAIEAGDGLLLACEAEGPTVFACGCCGEAALRGLLKPAAAFAALRESARGWVERCAAFELESGEAALDRYMSPWAVYQTLAGRLYGRCSLYQIGGAYGFRDQLQDAANLLLLEPELLRERLLDACRHQYAEGDVMHWWHELPGGDRGVRTRCSDDLLWLVWALCEYCEATGDTAICAREEPGLSSPPLQSGERDRYEAAVPGAPLTVLAHARNALACCLERGFGPHGLPLMGGGDWNDGLDRIGGESVWLGWFLASVEARFAELLGRLGEAGGEELRGQAAAVARAAENSFNGRFYERGFRPDGTPYGEDRLDSLAQSWAVLSGFGDPARARTALTAALGRLVDREHRLVKLFDPPWSADEPDPGYIAGCGEGFRENGGQYTHGAVWLAMACLRAGLRREGLELLRLLLPETHDARVYGAEPYVLAADVYAAPGREGEAGWSWYTGSSGWYFRAVCEELLGLRRRNGTLALRRLGFDCRASVLGHELRFSPEGVSADGKAPAEENFIELGTTKARPDMI